MWQQLSQNAWQTWIYLSSGRGLAIVLGIAFAVLAITLFVLSRTRWGQAKPLTICIVLSVLAHVFLLMYALGNRPILPQGSHHGSEQSLAVSLELADIPSLDVDLSEPIQSNENASQAEPQFWEKSILFKDSVKPQLLEEALEFVSRTDSSSPADDQQIRPVIPRTLPALPPEEPLADENIPSLVSDQAGLPSLPILPGQDNSNLELPELSAISTQENNDSEQTIAPEVSRAVQSSPLPPEYQLRQSPDRLKQAAAFGADADTEAAVSASLRWLAQAQSPDGSWNARQFGAGTETHALGESRYGTGAQADTGVSGLALLAFLSAGHTHLTGDYRDTVTSGLQFLLNSQMPSGDLSGPKQVGRDRGIINARMYCHAIATLALAEAYAMTKDDRLRNSLALAANYSLQAQDQSGGGWRYQPGESGDLSLFGWQAMALRSMERAGIQIPKQAKQRMLSFLAACSSGSAGGLANYRPGDGRPSATMTAEALACRLLLNYPLSQDAEREAMQMIMAHAPGRDEDNVYFWYYATLGLFQLQDSNWRNWNQALKERILTTQINAYAGSNAGSWDPDALWGGYGGRVYSTAMNCLCLEVYYRYLPLYQGRVLAKQYPPIGN
ncbi:MAG: terpene cyclase/mutase family protein [Planctomycetales bacterium]|nr:terpene cyclase/mutase family protein [Planctomycetales bacterium]